jgi:hypothetical protein
MYELVVVVEEAGYECMNRTDEKKPSCGGKKDEE